MALRVYNYLTGKLERFRPLDRHQVRIFLSGPTVYDDAHLGHAKTYVALDVVARYLVLRGYQVRCIHSFTDAGQMTDQEYGRLQANAQRAGVTPMELTDGYIWSFHDDMDALHVRRPDSAPRAPCHMPRMIAWIEDLLASGYAYEAGGNVLFSLASLGDTGGLGQLCRGDRVDHGVACEDLKRSPDDFVLWRSEPASSSMLWRSPWSQGSPSWHVANAVIANAYLGEQFDIHGGGTTHLISKTACQLAQAEAHNGLPAAKYWLMVGDLRVSGLRMSRTLGNHLTIRDALKLYSPEAIRYFLLSNQYREIADFRRDALQAAQRHVDYLHQTVRNLRWRMQEALPSMGIETAAFSGAPSLPDYREDFCDAMDRDFDTAGALTVVYDLVDQVNRTLASDDAVSLGTLSTMDKLLQDLAGGVLGILPETDELSSASKLVEQLVGALLDVRAGFIEARQWRKADAIRSRLDGMGVTVQDGPHGPSWRLQGQ